jgi:hypothetical protein
MSAKSLDDMSVAELAEVMRRTFAEILLIAYPAPEPEED